MKNATIFLNKKTFVHPFILWILFSASFSEQSCATVLTVDNNYPRIGQFATIQEAHDAASTGDTLYVFPSFVPYDCIIQTKKMITYGVGYKSPQFGLKTTLLQGNYQFNSGSEGSILTGFGGNFEIIIDTNDICIKKNSFNRVIIYKNHTGTIIMQNFINSGGDFLVDIHEVNEVCISNNLIINHSVWQNSYNSFCYNGKGIRASGIGNSLRINNNIIDLLAPNGTWANGYDIAMEIGNSNTIAFNNLTLIGAINGTTSGFSNNLFNIEASVVFININEKDYHLKSNSIASKTGLNGDDMGIYGGNTPFIDDGAPSLPSIYYMDIPTLSNQNEGLNIVIKAKTNK